MNNAVCSRIVRRDRRIFEMANDVTGNAGTKAGTKAVLTNCYAYKDVRRMCIDVYALPSPPFGLPTNTM